MAPRGAQRAATPVLGDLPSTAVYRPPQPRVHARCEHPANPDTPPHLHHESPPPAPKLDVPVHQREAISSYLQTEDYQGAQKCCAAPQKCHGHKERWAWQQWLRPHPNEQFLVVLHLQILGCMQRHKQSIRPSTQRPQPSHTDLRERTLGDCTVVAPSQMLSDSDYNTLRTTAVDAIRTTTATTETSPPRQICEGC
ncbi:hypothetical protein D9611_011350 [Ephemerocybe angulata]|uniref:Carbamoyl phosphate synthase ATP-binding domain-containing protein n=1 Tax=Ephemerocybe angulata TaxID=980116 RepID=A0A8H5F1L5_9AGAR|nr:hypothetical protein D9611_011350 [Tulosesus angulatus]